ncbi:hypothetical protein ANANG_G00304540 [Anguilla anguilla]|uniref:Uncharacterized protein n=1 Tax=Anguilla anguilla TaxID=7936 RepID=A0A9D3LRS4_ANGAN|nr:hypothetical protein ANANG_G00304540 [Anguilla anguilla]
MQVPRRVGQLHHADVLAAAARVPRGGQLPEGEVPPGAEGGPAAGGGQQRGQPRRHRRHLQLHLPQGAGAPGGLAQLLPGEQDAGAGGHGGPGVRAAREEPEPLGEAQLQAAVRGLRPGRGGAQGRHGVQLQLQVPLVLRRQVRPVPQDRHQVLLREEGPRRTQEEPPSPAETLRRWWGGRLLLLRAKAVIFIPIGHAPNSHTPNCHIPNCHTNNNHTPISHTPENHIPNSHTPNNHTLNNHTHNNHTSNSHTPNSHIPNSHTCNNPSHNSHTPKSHTPDSHSCNNYTPISLTPNNHTLNGHSTPPSSTPQPLTIIHPSSYTHLWKWHALPYIETKYIKILQ